MQPHFSVSRLMIHNTVVDITVIVMRQRHGSLVNGSSAGVKSGGTLSTGDVL